MKVNKETTTIESQAPESGFTRFKNLLKRRWKLLIVIISLLAVAGGAIWWGLRPVEDKAQVAAQKEADQKLKRKNEYLDQFKDN